MELVGVYLGIFVSFSLNLSGHRKVWSLPGILRFLKSAWSYLNLPGPRKI
jgi:hypothetical protein